MEFPKVMHHMWFQGMDSMPLKMQEYLSEWQEVYDDWVHMFWDENKIERFIRCSHPQYLEQYRRLPLLIQKCDFARYAILHTHGGIYADMDMKPISNGKAPMLERIEMMRPNQDMMRFDNGVLIAHPRHPVFCAAMEMAMSEPEGVRPQRWTESRNRYVLNTTGPVMLTRAILKTGSFVSTIPLTHRKKRKTTNMQERYVDATRAFAFALNDDHKSWERHPLYSWGRLSPFERGNLQGIIAFSAIITTWEGIKFLAHNHLARPAPNLI
jgi:mannosyltransferase OCH1-like enzyme